MTSARQAKDAGWELLGAVVLCVVVLGMEAAVDPSGWLWSALVRSAPIVLGVSGLSAVVVLARRSRSRRHPDAAG